jgi:hypothetical protein
MRLTPSLFENRLSPDRLQVDGHDADWFIVACVLKEPEKRSTRDPFNKLRREKLAAESVFLRGTFILEVEEDRVQRPGVDTGQVPDHIDVGWFALGRDKAAAHEHA